MRQLESMLQAAVVVAAIATVPVILLEQSRGVSAALEAIDWVLWSVFAVEYVVMLAVARNRRHCAIRAWPSVAVIVVSFPMMPAVFGAARLARLGRALRLLRLVAVTIRGFHALRAVFGRTALAAVSVVTAVLVVAAAAVLMLLEPKTVGHDFASALWWAIVTTTTVGYGDIVPITVGGRLAAVGLMLAGIGLVSTLSAAIVAYFVEEDENEKVSKLERRLDRIEALLTTLVVRDSAADARRSAQSAETRPVG